MWWQILTKLISAGASAYGTHALGQLGREGLKEQARFEEQAGEFNANQFKLAASSQLASDRANRAASGVAFTGSPLMVDRATVAQIALNEANIRTQAQARATALRNQAKVQKRAGKINTFTSFLGGLSGGFGDFFGGKK